MIIVYDRDEMAKEEIRKHAIKNCVSDIVLVNIGDAIFELRTEESNLFQEMNHLIGPIILYGKCSDEDSESLRHLEICARKDICWVENIFLINFQNLYNYLYLRSARLERDRINFLI